MRRCLDIPPRSLDLSLGPPSGCALDQSAGSTRASSATRRSLSRQPGYSCSGVFVHGACASIHMPRFFLVGPLAVLSASCPRSRLLPLVVGWCSAVCLALTVRRSLGSCFTLGRALCASCSPRGSSVGRYAHLCFTPHDSGGATTTSDGRGLDVGFQHMLKLSV